MRPFDRVLIVDWSARSRPAPLQPARDAIWIGTQGPGETSGQEYFRTRPQAEARLRAEIAANPGRLLIGFDFAMGYPQGFAAALTGEPSARAVWRHLASRVEDGPDGTNNRFAVAGRINAELGGGGPFWGVGPEVPSRKPVPRALPEFRRAERQARGAKSQWQLSGVGAVGSQTLLGLPMIHRLAALPGVAVWPFDPPTNPVVLTEVYPSLLRPAVLAAQDPIPDRAQVRLLARALYRLSSRGALGPLLAVPADVPPEEGWILGADHRAELLGALA